MMKKLFLILFLMSFSMMSAQNAFEVKVENKEEFDLFELGEAHFKRMDFERYGADVLFEHLELFKKFGTQDDVLIFKAANTELLIKKMIEEKRLQDQALTEAQNILIKNNLWNGTFDALFNAAWASVSSAAGGNRTFLLPAVWEIIKFSVEKGFQAYNMWDSYNYHIQDARNHAEVFDFYMGTLLKIQGNG